MTDCGQHEFRFRVTVARQPYLAFRFSRSKRRELSLDRPRPKGTTVENVDLTAYERESPLLSCLINYRSDTCNAAWSADI